MLVGVGRFATWVGGAKAKGSAVEAANVAVSRRREMEKRRGR